LNGFTFEANGIVLKNVNADQTLNFVGRPGTGYALYGLVSDGAGRGIEGVIVILGGTGPRLGTAVTNANGLYRFDNVAGGWNYVIQPYANKAVAYPIERTVSGLSGDVQTNFTITGWNQIDNSRFFVAQHYRDFLSREPDDSGLNFWTNGITSCTAPWNCLEPARVNTSAAFFLSIEFQETGYLVERIYKSAYGEADALSALDTYPSQHPIKAPIVRFNEFLGDSQQISKNVQVGVGNWTAQLEANKVAFTQDFVTRTRFTTAYPTTMTPAQFVDALFQKAVVVPTSAERDSIIAEFGGAGTSTDTFARARALRRVAENTVLKQQETSKAFVLMQYFGYLRRDPNGAPDTDHTGYDFWLTKLNAFGGNYVNAQMVEAFIVSGEYRNRFGP
jgi:hypothetical protein